MENLPHLAVKGGILINNGENPTRESRHRLNKEYSEKFGVSKEQLEQLNEIELYKVKRQKRKQFYKFLQEYFERKKKQVQVIDDDKPISSSTQLLTRSVEGMSEAQLRAELKQVRAVVAQLEVKAFQYVQDKYDAEQPPAKRRKI